MKEGKKEVSKQLQIWFADSTKGISVLSESSCRDPWNQNVSVVLLKAPCPATSAIILGGYFFNSAILERKLASFTHKSTWDCQT